MQLPQRNIHKKCVALLLCKECGREYWATAKHSRYCPQHATTDAINKRTRDKRAREKIINDSRYGVVNQIIQHKYKEAIKLEFKCGVEGCDNLFPIILYQGQEIYPRYCPQHRNEHQRNMFIEKQKTVGGKNAYS